MKQLLTTTLAATLVIGLAGCNSSSKTDGDTPENSRANENAIERIGNDAVTVGEGTLDAVGAGIDAVGNVGAAGIDAVGNVGAAVIDALKGDEDKEKSDHPDHPDHPDS